MEARVLLAVLALAITPALMASPAMAAAPTKDECIDANEAAQTLGESGKLMAERQKLVVCVSSSCPGPVRQDCAQRLTEVDAKMPTLILEARDDSDHDMVAVHVTMDGRPLFDRLDGKAYPIDPGEHHFVYEAPGFTRVDRVIVVREAEKNRHDRVVLTAVPAPAPPAPAAAPAPAPAPAPAAESSSALSEEPLSFTQQTSAPPGAVSGTPSDGRTQRVIGLALGGAGVVGGLVGAAFGLASKSTYDKALTSECNGTPSQCSHDGVQDGQTARSQATIATVGFIGGLALLGGGAFLYFTAPKGTEISISPNVGKTEAGLSFRGKW
jgi:hypothetical protein